MRLTILFLLCSICSVAQVLRSPQGQMHYLEYIDPACVDCPVYIFAHGSGECGTDINKVYKNGTPKLLKAANKTFLPGFIMIVPQTTNCNGWIGDPNNPECIKFLKYIHQTYDCRAGVFVSGLSAGGGFAWESTYNGHSIEGMVTGIVPVSTASNYNGGFTTAERKIHVWGIHGSNDTTQPPNNGKQAINAMNLVPANPAPKWTLINGGGHGSNTWDVAYSLTPRAELGNTTIYAWMLSKKKPVDGTPPVALDTVKFSYIKGDSVYHVGKSGKVIKK